MPSLLTPKRRKPNRKAMLEIEALASEYYRQRMYSGMNAAQSVGGHTGALKRQLIALVTQNDAMPTGVIEVPPSPNDMSRRPFTVDLDKLREARS
jgi:hypothetical protein